ncbi:hypothetical protein J5N97_013130 [Dioscorea zingiberensis]|uniref:Uncharacterized protein n=1 Tax=Dioscorea zingiberensis TaxID=325984 RepID=A0A9D5HIC9_9LILI|nr:hypothetical protein J5N97_013130 [Dioscorea zingiberensis]
MRALLSGAAATGPTYLKFENRSRALCLDASNHWFYPIELKQDGLQIYPEGNFGRNQLLDDRVGRRALRGSRLQPSFALPVSATAGSRRMSTLGPRFQDGSDGEPAGRCRSAAASVGAGRGRCCAAHGRWAAPPRAGRPPGFAAGRCPRSGPLPEAEAADRSPLLKIRRGASPAPIRFPPDNFKHSLTLFSKCFSSFLADLFAIGLARI